jgi:hypothetical protein
LQQSRGVQAPYRLIQTKNFIILFKKVEPLIMSSKPPIRHSGNGGFYNLGSEIGFFFFTKNLDQMINSLTSTLEISSNNKPNISAVNLIDFSSMAMELTGLSHIRSNGIKASKKYRRPEWQKRSPINDVFCRYGLYFS